MYMYFAYIFGVYFCFEWIWVKFVLCFVLRNAKNAGIPCELYEALNSTLAGFRKPARTARPMPLSNGTY